MSATSATAIDLSRLPAPQVVGQIDYAAILADLRADMLARYPGFSAAVESDPVQKLLEVAAYREMMLRAEFNARAQGCLVAFATGGDLDNLGALLGAARLLIQPGDPLNGIAAAYESDADFRRRIILAPEGYSVAGPAGAYVFHALSADGEVLDASATSPSPGEVVVTVLARGGDGTASPALLTAVETAVSAEDVRPLTDHVTVQAATIVPYAIEAVIETFAGPDSLIVLAEAEARLAATIAASRRLGRDIVRSGIFAALHVEGVSQVTLTSPAADVALDRTEAAHCTGVTLTYAGTGE
ncbi:MAG: baseplate assembly protein [Alphaproteobacteria bacterium HGW-Alphaproteobacteria-13]|nr:MAG: baseplate assembly protein [Alphaproteobacteria bacterium HGW-Alphaproteobacteria-13]